MHVVLSALYTPPPHRDSYYTSLLLFLQLFDTPSCNSRRSRRRPLVQPLVQHLIQHLIQHLSQHLSQRLVLRWTLIYLIFSMTILISLPLLKLLKLLKPLIWKMILRALDPSRFLVRIYDG